MRVEQIDFVTVPTRDVTRAFWNLERDGESFAPNVAGIGFRVPNVEEACAQRAAGGGEVVGLEDTGVCHMGFCTDLEGNTIILHRRYAPRVPR